MYVVINPEHSNAKKQVLLKMIISGQNKSKYLRAVETPRRAVAVGSLLDSFCGVSSVAHVRIEADHLLHIGFSFPHKLFPPPTIKRCLISLKIREVQSKSKEMLFLHTRLAKMKKFDELPWCEHGKACWWWRVNQSNLYKQTWIMNYQVWTQNPWSSNFTNRNLSYRSEVSRLCL